MVIMVVFTFYLSVMWVLDLLGGSSDKLGGVLELFRGEESELRTTVVDSVFDTKMKSLEDKIEESETAKGSIEKMSTLLAGTKFEAKFSESDMYGEQWPEQFEKFNQRINLLLSSYLDGALDWYSTEVKTEIVVGMQFALMKKLWEAGSAEAINLFSAFKNVDADPASDDNKKGILKKLFSWFSESTKFMWLGRKFMNLTTFLGDYKTEMWDGTHLKSRHIKELLENSFFDSRSNWYDATTKKIKTLDQIKDKLPYDGLNATTMAISDTTEIDKKEKEMVANVADDPDVLKAMNEQVLDAM